MRASTCEGEQFGHERSPLAREVTALDSPTSECLTDRVDVQTLVYTRLSENKVLRLLPKRPLIDQYDQI